MRTDDKYTAAKALGIAAGQSAAFAKFWAAPRADASYPELAKYSAAEAVRLARCAKELFLAWTPSLDPMESTRAWAAHGMKWARHGGAA
jgi:hypothetical protein